MSDYNKATNFSVKDTLTSGDPDKVVSGAEIDNEFDAISSAVGSKADKVADSTTDNLAALDANGNLKDSSFPGNATVPSGGIIMWSGLISDIPTGWVLCDGNNTTPDLRDRFIVGAGSTYSRNDTGGANSVTLTENQMPSHNHSMNSAGSHTHTATAADEVLEGAAGPFTVRVDSGSGSVSGVFADSPTVSGGAQENTANTSRSLDFNGTHGHTVDVDSAGNHTHTINNTGGDGSHENRPPYFALAFIMKL